MATRPPAYLLRRALFFLRGTFAPAARASDKPIAIACLRLVTFLPERPLRNVPALRSSITFFTLAEAFLPYFRAMIPVSFSADANRRRTRICSSIKRAAGLAFVRGPVVRHVHLAYHRPHPLQQAAT